jgi:hypothetical protein
VRRAFDIPPERRSVRPRDTSPARLATTPAGDLLALQHAAGNRAVVQRLGHGQAVLQRKPVGLREPTPISTYAKEALDYWKEPGNAKKTLQDFANHLFGKANDALKALNVWPMLKKFDSTQQTPGEFDSTTWTIGLNDALFVQGRTVTEVGQLTADEAAQISGTIYHESRHAEQHFQIARTVAGASTATGNALVQEIMKSTQLPVDPARAASTQPLAKTAANKDRLAEAADWESVITGPHGRFRNIVVPWELEARSAKNIAYDPLRGTKARATMEQFFAFWRGARRKKVVTDHIKTVKALKRKTGVDRLMLTHLQAIETQLAKVEKAWAAFQREEAKLSPSDLLKAFEAFKKKSLQSLIDVLHKAYVAFPTEDDAFAAEKAVIKEFGALAAPPKPAPQPKARPKPKPQPQQ